MLYRMRAKMSITFLPGSAGRGGGKKGRPEAELARADYLRAEAACRKPFSAFCLAASLATDRSALQAPWVVSAAKRMQFLWAALASYIAVSAEAMSCCGECA